MPIGHTFFKRYLTIRPSEGLVFEVIGKYHKPTEEKHFEKKLSKTEQKPIAKKDERAYTKKLMKFIDKDISPKKEQHELDDMHDIEHITEEIEKGKGR